MSTFKDHFSQQAGIYARYRPQYPEALYAWLATLTPQHQLAWDCGTGNGQAALALARHYRQVMATDPSTQQIAHAVAHPHITYRVERAEHSSLVSHSADLITIANALHWMDFETFYVEVKRVLKPGAVIAAWAYALPDISPEVDQLIHDFHYGPLDAYWLPENRLVEKRYRTIPFPFKEIDSPEFYCEKQMTLPDLIGYLNTWSATQRYIAQNNVNPTDGIFEQLKRVWTDAKEEKMVRWKLTLKVGIA